MCNDDSSFTASTLEDSTSVVLSSVSLATVETGKEIPGSESPVGSLFFPPGCSVGSPLCRAEGDDSGDDDSRIEISELSLVSRSRRVVLLFIPAPYTVTGS